MKCRNIRQVQDFHPDRLIDLAVGTTFYLDTVLYLKTDIRTSRWIGCVCLEDGVMLTFEDDRSVCAAEFDAIEVHDTTK
jgi:hypothetical protein